MAFKALCGLREAKITEHLHGKEFIRSTRRLVEEIYPQAKRIRAVFDNLSTHTAAAFYETFAPEIAHRLAQNIEPSTPRVMGRG